VWGVGCGVWNEVWGLGFEIWGLGFGGKNLGVRVKGSSFQVSVLGLRLRVQALLVSAWKKSAAVSLGETDSCDESQAKKKTSCCGYCRENSISQNLFVNEF